MKHIGVNIDRICFNLAGNENRNSISDELDIGSVHPVEFGDIHNQKFKIQISEIHVAKLDQM